jgi:hypothetical protein
MPDYLGGAKGIGDGLGLEANVVGVVEGAGIAAVGEVVGDPVMVCGDWVPGPSGSMTVVGATVELVSVELVSVGLVSVVVVGVVVVLLGWT